jgi:hypothetical protein
VKKYHHSPGFGVKSGSESLQEMSRLNNREEAETYSTNHVCHIHCNPPETNIEVRVSAKKRARNSRPIPLPFLKLMDIGVGLAKQDFGWPSKSIITGSTSKTDDKETCTSAARQKSAGEVFPSRYEV